MWGQPPSAVRRAEGPIAVAHHNRVGFKAADIARRRVPHSSAFFAEEWEPRTLALPILALT
jgi:hypothetical protein